MRPSSRRTRSRKTGRGAVRRSCRGSSGRFVRCRKEHVRWLFSSPPRAVSPEVEARDRALPAIATLLRKSGYSAPTANAAKLYDMGYGLRDVERLAQEDRLEELAVFKN